MKKKNLGDFYNKMYARKNTTAGSRLFLLLRRFEKHRTQAVSELIEGGERLLDVACGDGELLFLVNQKFKEAYGIDISSERIKRVQNTAKENKIGNVFFKIVDVNDGLPFKDKYFDVVTAVAALAFFFDPYFVLSQINRVLKKDGVLVVEVPNTAYLPRRLSLLLGKFPQSSSTDFGWDGGHLHYFTQETLEKLINDFGFEIIKITGSGIFAKLRNFWPSLLCGNIIIKAIKK